MKILLFILGVLIVAVAVALSCKNNGKCSDCVGKGTFKVGGTTFSCPECQGTGEAQD